MLAGLDFQLITEITHGSATAILAVGLAFVWRAYQAAVAANSAYQKELLSHMGELSQIPVALDRLRCEVLDELRDMRRH